MYRLLFLQTMATNIAIRCLLYWKGAGHMVPDETVNLSLIP